jgi:PAS domain S-box-containing protein
VIGNMLEQMKIGTRLWLLVGVATTALLLVAGEGLYLLRQTMLSDRQINTRNLVETAYGVVAHYGALAAERKLRPEEAQSQAISVLRGLRYQGNEYFWVNTIEPRMVMHPSSPELEGQDLSGYKDSAGKPLFAEIAKVARGSGAGFVDYYWPKPGGGGPVAKVSYVKLYEPWGWIIGSGVYLDDVEGAFESELLKFSGFAVVVLLLIGLVAWGTKLTGETLYRLNRKLKAISRCHQILMRAENEQKLLDAVCRIVCDEAGYRMAWVGYAEHDDAKTLRPVAWAGCDSSYLANAELSWADDTERGAGLAGKAIRSGETIYVQDLASDLPMAQSRESFSRHGLRSGVAVPIKDEEARAFGVLVIYSGEIRAINQEEIGLLEELSGDLAFGIVTQRTRNERRRADEALVESEAKYRRIVDTSGEGIWMIGPDLRTNFVNARMAEMVGYSAEEMLGRPFTDFIFEEDVPDHESKIGHRRQGVAEIYERRFRCKDGRTLWTQASATPILDEARQYNGSFAMFSDITERKHAEETLRKRNEELEAFEKLVIGRELRMVELKKRIVQLESALAREKEKHFET